MLTYRPSGNLTSGQRSLLLSVLSDIVYHRLYFLRATISVLRTILFYSVVDLSIPLLKVALMRSDARAPTQLSLLYQLTRPQQTCHSTEGLYRHL